MRPQVLTAAFPQDLPPLPVSRVFLKRVPVLWEEWVAAWRGDQEQGTPPVVNLMDYRLLPAEPAAQSPAAPAALVG
jgi:hypothetical protein